VASGLVASGLVDRIMPLAVAARKAAFPRPHEAIAGRDRAGNSEAKVPAA
jgi:hypothetical protein